MALQIRDIGSGIAEILQDEGVGVIGTDIFVSQKPNKPDFCIATYASGGQPPDPHSIYNPSVMIHVRGNKIGRASGRERVYSDV